MLLDQHLHSRHSFDCKTDPEENVRAVIEMGLDGLIFTEHFDPHPKEWRQCIYNHEQYTAALDALRRRYGDRLFIGQGIEIGYAPGRMHLAEELLESQRFDLVILSQHYMGDRDMHKKEDWAGLTPAEGTRLYFKSLQEAVEYGREVQGDGGERLYHVLGHLDLVKRYSRRYFGEIHVADCGEQIAKVLSICLEAGLVPEINTSSWRQGLDEPMPGLSTLKTWARLGGRAVSLGSDAHRAEHIGADFDRAIELAREAGIERIAAFREGLEGGESF